LNRHIDKPRKLNSDLRFAQRNGATGETSKRWSGKIQKFAIAKALGVVRSPRRPLCQIEHRRS